MSCARRGHLFLIFGAVDDKAQHLLLCRRATCDWLLNRFEHAESQPSTVDLAKFADTCIVGKEAPHLLDDDFITFRHDTAVSKSGGGEFLGRLVIVGFHQGYPAIEVCHRPAGKRLHFDRRMIAVPEILLGRLFGLFGLFSLRLFLFDRWFGWLRRRLGRLPRLCRLCRGSGRLGLLRRRSGGPRRGFGFRFAEYGQNAYTDEKHGANCHRCCECVFHAVSYLYLVCME